MIVIKGKQRRAIYKYQEVMSDWNYITSSVGVKKIPSTRFLHYGMCSCDYFM